jgi:hypothetical protein
MKFPRLNPYYRAALILIVAALVLVAIAVVTDRRDLTSAALVIASTVCLVTGIFLATLSGGDPLDLRYVSLLPVQGCINLSRVCADLGIMGNACILPPGKDGRVSSLHFIPVADYHPSPPGGNSFVTGSDTAGLMIVPAAAPLLEEIRDREHMVVPSDMPALLDLVREVGVDVLEIADLVTTTTDGTNVTVKLDEYRLTHGCRAMRAESPKCCTTNPCPVISLIACLLSEGTKTVVQVERCSPDDEGRSVTAAFTLIP